MNPQLCEDMPATGSVAKHEHRWVKVPNAGTPGHDYLACDFPGCGITRLVRAPQTPRQDESAPEKPLLLG